SCKINISLPDLFSNLDKMIELNNLTFSYTKKGVPALLDLNGRIEPGIHLLAGENGAGKTTLLHLLAGVASPTSGTILINGTVPATDNPVDKGTTFLLEENTTFPMKTIRKFAEVHSPFYPHFSNSRFCDNLHAFGLTGDEPMKSMSLGTRKKALLAYALALGVDTLLLDEPTNALDIQSKEILKTLIAQNISDNQTLIISTHTVSELENLFDGALMMAKGALLWAGTEQELTDRLAFEKSRTPDPDALYTEPRLGHFLSILPAVDGEPTNVDWRLLYSALHSPKCNDVLNILKTKKR
ncbi:MAG: ABC transporter ATP-binding protein, partial [Muribaculaceae bacterium]|nr:ABC transporter ATP-binding protein [Muribaculaceae bacterium]